MSSISKSNPNSPPPQGLWTTAAQYLVPPVAASVAIVPVFYGFIAKSAQQTGKPIPAINIQVLKDSLKAAPTIGVIVGTQMIAQTIIEKTLMKASSTKKDQAPSFATMLASSMLVGAISGPGLAVFNGQTMGRTIKQSLKSLSVKQTGSIVARETSFLFSLRVSGPISELMKKNYGENKAVEYSTSFVTGAFGSLIGHPADTALTLWQKGMKVESLRQTMRGSPIKALAVGGFSICYKAATELLEPFSQLNIDSKK